MKFLAIDTSGKRLVVAAEHDNNIAVSEKDCAMQHSVLLMGEIEDVLSRVSLSLADCDALACVVGPGSFTGIRIGISAIKGMAFGAEKKTLAVTSFDAIAYADKSEKKIAVVDAGHGFVYAAGYGLELAAGYYSAEEILALGAKHGAAILSAEALPFETKVVRVAEGLLAAVRANFSQAGSAEALAALYLRKSSAEEGR